MGGKVVDRDDIPAFEGWGKALLDIGQKPLPGHCPVDGLRRPHAMPTQRAHQGDGLPVALRDMPHQPLGANATAVQPHHLGVGRSLINEDQSGRIKHALFSHPAPPRPCYVRAFLLGRAQGFF